MSLPTISKSFSYLSKNANNANLGSFEKSLISWLSFSKNVIGFKAKKQKQSDILGSFACIPLKHA